MKEMRKSCRSEIRLKPLVDQKESLEHKYAMLALPKDL